MTIYNENEKYIKFLYFSLAFKYKNNKKFNVLPSLLLKSSYLTNFFY